MNKTPWQIALLILICAPIALPTPTVAVPNLNLRPDPGIDRAPIAVLHRGDWLLPAPLPMPAGQDPHPWSFVFTPHGPGWIHTHYTTLNPNQKGASP